MGPHHQSASGNTEPPAVAPIFPANAGQGTEARGASSEAVRILKKHRLWTLAFLSLLMGFASLSTDLYLPAMPVMARNFGDARGMMEWTISGYLIGFCLGQLFWGPLSDRIGRRVPVAAGILLFIIGSAGCAISESAGEMIAWRVAQALGACACVVLARAMVRDLYQGARAAQMLSILITVMAAAPLVGPFVGGQILALFGWKAIFWTLAGVGAATLAALRFLPETLEKERRNSDPFAASLAQYARIVRSRAVLAYAGASGCFYGGLFAYIAGTPFAYIDYYRLPAEYYGFLFASGVLGIMACNIANSRLAHVWGIRKSLTAGGCVMAAAGCALAIAGKTGIGGIWGLALPIFAFVSMNGFVVANSLAGAMERFPRHAGAASAVVGAIQSACGVLGSALVGALADGTPRPMCAVIAVCGISALAFAMLVPAKETPQAA